MRECQEDAVDVNLCGIRVLARSIFRNKSSKNMTFPHPKSRKNNYRKCDIPNHGRVVRKFFERTINISDYRTAKDDVNTAEDRTFGGLFHDCFVHLFIGGTASRPGPPGKALQG